MKTLPFKTYVEATEFFGISIPQQFYTTLTIIENYCKNNNLNTLEVIDDLFGIARLEGEQARYQQTPPELFPFGSLGGDGVHYGFVAHTLNDGEFISGEICPMDSDGVVLLGIDNQSLFQNLLVSKEAEKYQDLIKVLNLNPVLGHKDRYDSNGNGRKISVRPRRGWRHIFSADGLGVFAEEEFFSPDDTHDFLIRYFDTKHYENLAAGMQLNGFYASQLFYLKELYWHGWADFEIGKKYLTEMLIPYQKLGREHLYNATLKKIEYFATTYGV